MKKMIVIGSMLLMLLLGGPIISGIYLDHACNNTGIDVYEVQEVSPPFAKKEEDLEHNNHFKIGNGYFMEAEYFKDNYKSKTKEEQLLYFGPVYKYTTEYYSKRKNKIIAKYSFVYTKSGWINKIITFGMGRKYCVFYKGVKYKSTGLVSSHRYMNMFKGIEK